MCVSVTVIPFTIPLWMGRNEGSVNCISDFEGGLKERLIDTKIAQMKKNIPKATHYSRMAKPN